MTAVVTKLDFDKKVLKSDKPVLVDLYADWCGQCRMLGPIVDQVNLESEGKYDIYKLNVDHDPEIAQQYGVMSIPTLLFFKGGQLALQTVGVIKKERIVEELEKLKTGHAV